MLNQRVMYDACRERREDQLTVNEIETESGEDVDQLDDHGLDRTDREKCDEKDP